MCFMFLAIALQAKVQGGDIKRLDPDEARLARDFFEAIKNDDKEKYASLFSNSPDRAEGRDAVVSHRNRKLSYLHDYALYRSKDFGVDWVTADVGNCYKDENDAIVIQLSYSREITVVAEIRIGEVMRVDGKVVITSRSKAPINVSARIVGDYAPSGDAQTKP